MAEADFRFVPLVCGQCTGRMAAGKKQVLYQCHVCGGVWECSGGKLLSKEMIRFSGSGDIHLPFWHATFSITCLEGIINDTAGFMKICGSVKVSDMSSAPPHLFIPAFSLPLQQAIKLGRNMTVRFPSFLLASVQDSLVEPVTLSEADAPLMAEMILLASLVEELRTSRSFLASFSVQLTSLAPVSIPFTRKESRLLQLEMNLEI